MSIGANGLSFRKIKEAKMFIKDNPVDIKRAKHEMMSKSEWTDYRAKVWFESKPYGKHEGRRADYAEPAEQSDERQGI